MIVLCRGVFKVVDRIGKQWLLKNAKKLKILHFSVAFLGQKNPQLEWSEN